MSFPQKIKDEIFVKCARHCCVCHKPKGLNIEVHHITPKMQKGQDTFENAIALCFDCHADAGHYFAGHPKGSKLSPNELIKHKEEWFEIVQKNKIDAPKDIFVDIVVDNPDFEGYFKPKFIKEETRFIDRDSYKRIYELLGKDPMEMVKDLKDRNKLGTFYIPFVNKINTYDEFIDYLNGDFPKKNFLEPQDENENTNCQPIKHLVPDAFFSSGHNKEVNLSNCVLNLKLINYGPAILEDYKVYLTFENVVEADSVNKRKEFFDAIKYEYNVRFLENNKGEFYPKRNILVQNDSVNLDTICFRVKHNIQKIKVSWKLLARNIQTNGTIEVEIKPEIEVHKRERFIPTGEERDNEYRILPEITFK
jgi:HNH endonuclease